MENNAVSQACKSAHKNCSQPFKVSHGALLGMPLQRIASLTPLCIIEAQDCREMFKLPPEKTGFGLRTAPLDQIRLDRSEIGHTSLQVRMQAHVVQFLPVLWTQRYFGA